MRIAGEIFAIQLLAFVITLLTRGGQQFWPHLMINAIFTNCIAWSIRSFFVIAQRASFYDNWDRPRKTAYTVGAIFVGTCVGITLSSLILQPLTGQPFLRAETLLRLLPGTLLVATIVTLLFHGYYILKERIESEALKNEHLKQLQAHTEMMALQSKMNPHFLFNTLNTMLDLVHDSPDKVEKMILGLSDIYRRMLHLPDVERIDLADELDLIREYLNIEQVRLGARLHFTITVEPGLERVPVPPLLIEPLVENAVIHGIGPVPKGGEIHLSVTRRDGRLEVVVEDNGAGFAPDGGRRGFGLYSIQERVRFLGGTGPRIETPAGGGTRITLELPDEH